MVLHTNSSPGHYINKFEFNNVQCIRKRILNRINGLSLYQPTSPIKVTMLYLYFFFPENIGFIILLFIYLFITL